MRTLVVVVSLIVVFAAGRDLGRGSVGAPDPGTPDRGLHVPEPPGHSGDLAGPVPAPRDGAGRGDAICCHACRPHRCGRQG